MKQGTARPLSGKGSRTKSTFESKEVYDERMEALKVSKRVLKVTSLPVQSTQVKKPASAPSSSTPLVPTTAIVSSMVVENTVPVQPPQLLKTVALPAPSSSSAAPFSTALVASSRVPVSSVSKPKPTVPVHLRTETWNMPLHKQAKFVSLFAFMSFTFFSNSTTNLYIHL